MKSRLHQIQIELCDPLAAEFEVGAAIPLKIRVRCPAGCDLRGAVKVMASEEIAATRDLVTYDQDQAATEPEVFTVIAPAQVAEFCWQIVFQPQEIGGGLHEAGCLPITFKTVPRRTSLAVWAVLSPVRLGEHFSIKVGAKSSGAVDLKGAQVEVVDDIGTQVGSGRLGEAPWPGPSALYWTEIALLAPMKEGVSVWSARFPATELALPHGASSAQFSFATVRQPEHQLLVQVVDQATQSPVGNVQVCAGPFRRATDGAGQAVLELPSGKYKLALWKAGYRAPAREVEMVTDMRLELQLVRTPKDDGNDRWM